MNKTAALLASIILAASVFTACNTDNKTIKDDDSSSSTIDFNQEIDKALNADGPSLTAMSIDFAEINRGRIIPCLSEYKEDAWEKEKDTFLYAFMTTEGELICNSYFDSVSYNEDVEAYLVRRSDNGISKYGMISNDGSKFTGLIFDGAATAQGANTGNAVYYGTTFVDGYLWITGVDKDLNILDSKKINVDESELGLDAKTSQLTVLYTNDESSVIINKSEFYYKTMLVNNSSGKLLYTFKNFGSSCKVFGNVLVEQDMTGKGINVYNMRGESLICDKNAFSGMVSEDRYMVVVDNKVNLYDADWNVVKSLDVPNATDVMASFGRIAVVDNEKTCVYDKDLNLISTLDFPVYGGTYFRDWYNYGEGDMYYDSISGTKEIINLNTGAKLAKKDEFSYSFKYGYIIADNNSYGNDPVKKWFVYDQDFDLIASGEGRVDIIRDEDNGDKYIVNNKDDVMIVYSLPANTRMFGYKFTCYNLSAVNGRFYGSNKEQFLLCNSIGEELCAYKVDYTKGKQF